MTRKDCGSNTSGIHMMVDYWTELVGNWPNIKMRWHYSMFIKEDYWQNSLQWNEAVFMFHTNKHTFNVNLSGATQTGVLAAGVLDLPFGNGQAFIIHLDAVHRLVTFLHQGFLVNHRV